MHRTIPSWIIMLLALFLASGPASAGDDDAWRADAADDGAENGYTIIDSETFSQLRKSDPDLMVIDVRADYEFEAGHIPGARNLEFDLGDRMRVTPEKRAAFESLAGPDKKRRLVIYCRSFR